MTVRRWMWIFIAIALAAFTLAAAGRFLLAWPDYAVGAWVGIGGGYLIAALLMLVLPRWWRQHCDEMFATQASRRYQRAVWPAMIVYSLLLFASMWWIKRGIEPVALRALVAVAPVLPLLFFLRAALRYLREIDELQRRIETEAIGIASLLVSMLYFAGGLLQQAKVIDVHAGNMMIMVFPLLCGIYGIAKMVLTRRYL
ncbi:MAG: hypothetical protein QM612_10545 [Thermomonas sp.]|uniref:hypothetical protein n=1 Tax=Thermomonas sp. TaxID=1971895 RepID=UPI0039E3EF27